MCSTTAPSNGPPNRDTKADTIIELEHGKPLIFGKNRDKGIRLNGMQLEVVELGKGIEEDDLLFHDEKMQEPSLAYLLSRMRHPEFPEPIGVFRDVDRPRYEERMNSANRRSHGQTAGQLGSAVQLRRHLGRGLELATSDRLAVAFIRRSVLFLVVLRPLARVRDTRRLHIGMELIRERFAAN